MQLPVIPDWATEATYPTGTYAGTPTMAAPTGDLIIPNTKPGARQHNYLYKDFYRQPRNVMAAGISAALNRWSGVQASSGLSSGYPFTGADYDSFNGRWLFVTGTTAGGGNTQFFQSFDQGGTWEVLQTITGNVSQGLACAGSNGAITCLPNGSQLEVSRLKADDTTTTHLVPSFPATTATPFALPFAFTGGNVWGILAANQAGGAFSGGSLVLTNDGATFSTVAFTPSAWNASAANHVGQFLVASNATTILAALCGVTAGSDQPRLMTITSVGGTPTFTDLSTLTSSILAGVIITGLAWDGTYWGVLTYDGTNSRLYTSPDLTTWTNVASWAGVQCAGLAVVGNVWAVGVPYATTLKTGARVQISTNVQGAGAGGATFSWTNIGLLDAVPLPLAFRSSGHGLFAASAAKGAISGQFGQL